MPHSVVVVVVVVVWMASFSCSCTITVKNEQITLVESVCFVCCCREAQYVNDKLMKNF